MAFCKGMRPKIKTIINKVDKFVDTAANNALDITARLKPLLDSPLGAVLTEIIPGTWDNELRTKASDLLGTIVSGLTVSKTIAAEPDLTKKIQLFMCEIATQHPEYQEALLFKIASLLTKYLHGDKLSDSEYDLITQAKYISKK